MWCGWGRERSAVAAVAVSIHGVRHRLFKVAPLFVDVVRERATLGRFLALLTAICRTIRWCISDCNSAGAARSLGHIESARALRACGSAPWQQENQCDGEKLQHRAVQVLIRAGSGRGLSYVDGTVRWPKRARASRDLDESWLAVSALRLR